MGVIFTKVSEVKVITNNPDKYKVTGYTLLKETKMSVLLQTIRQQTMDFLYDAEKRNESIKDVVPYAAYDNYRTKIQEEITHQEWRLTLGDSVVFMDEATMIIFEARARKAKKQSNKRLK